MNSTLSAQIQAAKNASTIRSLVIYARMLGISWGVDILFDPRMTTAATDGRQIRLRPLDVGTEEDAVLLEGLIVHEAGVHCRFTDFDAAGKALANQPDVIASLSNIFEDVWGERELYQVMPGCRTKISRSLDILTDRQVFTGPTKVTHPASTMMNMLLCGLRAVKLGQTQLADFYLQHRQMLEEQVGPELVDQIWSTAQKIDSTCSSTAAIDLSVEIFNLIKEAQQQAENQAKQQQSSNDQSSQDQSQQGQPSPGQPSQDQSQQGQPSPGQPSQNQSQQGQPAPGQPSQDQSQQGQPAPGQPSQDQSQQGQPAPGQPSQDQSQQGQPSPGQPSQDQSQQGQPSPAQSPTQSPASGDGGITQPNPPAGQQAQPGKASQNSQDSTTPPSAQTGLSKPGHKPKGSLSKQQIDNMRKVLDANKQEAGTGELADALVTGMSETAAPDTRSGYGAGNNWDIHPSKPVQNVLVDHAVGVLARPVAVKLGSKLDQILAVQTTCTSELSVRGRRLSSRMIPRLMTAATMRVFKRTEEAESLDVAVSILQDISTSMSAKLDDEVPCINAVGASTRALGDTLDRFDVPFSVHQFGAKLTQVKAFDDRWRRTRSLHYQDLEGSTCTHQALNRVVPALAARSEERRLLVLETDGIPSDVKRTIAALCEAQALGVNVAVFLVGSTASVNQRRLQDFMAQMSACGIPHAAATSSSDIAKVVFDAVSSATSSR